MNVRGEVELCVCVFVVVVVVVPAPVVYLPKNDLPQAVPCSSVASFVLMVRKRHIRPMTVTAHSSLMYALPTKGEEEEEERISLPRSRGCDAGPRPVRTVTRYAYT
jgi:hypothetical protein